MAITNAMSRRSSRTDLEKRTILANWDAADAAGKRDLAVAVGVAFTTLSSTTSRWRKQLGIVATGLRGTRKAGVACNPLAYSEAALNRLYALKGREFLRSVADMIDRVIEQHRLADMVAAKYAEQRAEIEAEMQTKLDALEQAKASELRAARSTDSLNNA